MKCPDLKWAVAELRGTHTCGSSKFVSNCTTLPSSARVFWVAVATSPQTAGMVSRFYLFQTSSRWNHADLLLWAGCTPWSYLWCIAVLKVFIGIIVFIVRWHFIAYFYSSTCGLMDYFQGFICFFLLADVGGRWWINGALLFSSLAFLTPGWIRYENAKALGK